MRGSIISRVSRTGLVAVLLLCQWPSAFASVDIRPEAIAGDASVAPSLRVEPATTLVLGRTQRVVLTISASEDEEDPPLRLSANVGSLGEIERIEAGVYRSTFTPPSTRFPQVAVIAAWRETGPHAAVSFFRIPLFGTATVPLQTSPGAEIFFDVGGRRFGPFVGGDDGRVVARLVVPPGVRDATVTALNEDGEEVSQQMELGIPPYNRLTLAVVPHAITADGVSQARLILYYDDTSRRMPSPEDFTVETSLERATPLEHLEGPLFLGEFTAASGTPDQEASFKVRVRRDRTSHGEAVVRVGRQRPVQIRAEPTSRELVADGSTAVELAVQIRDELGLGVPGLELEAEVQGSGLELMRDIVDVGAGRYEVALMPTRMYPPAQAREARVTVRVDDVSVEIPVTLHPWSPASIDLEPASSRLVADGRSTATFLAKAWDAEARPMTDLVLTASATEGSIESVEELSGGEYEIVYRSPMKERSDSGTAAADHEIEALVEVRVGTAHAASTVRLAPLIVERRRYQGFFAASAGLISNLGALHGPSATLRAGLTTPYGDRLELGGSIWTGFSRQTASWASGNASGEWRLVMAAIPIIGAASLELPLDDWSLGVDLGVGLLLAPGQARLGETTISVGSVLPAVGGRARLGRQLGHGQLLVELSYLSARRTKHRGIVDFTGQAGGLCAAVGYRIELWGYQ